MRHLSKLFLFKKIPIIIGCVLIIILFLVTKVNMHGRVSYTIEGLPRFFFIPKDSKIVYSLISPSSAMNFFPIGRNLTVYGIAIPWWRTSERYNDHSVLIVLYYQASSNRTQVEGYLSIVDNGDLYLETTGRERVKLVGNYTKRLKWVVEKLEGGSLDFTYTDLGLQATGRGFYQPNSATEIFEIETYSFYNTPSLIDLDKLFLEYGENAILPPFCC